MRISSVLTSFRFSDFPYGESIALFSCVDDQEKENDNQRDSTKDRVDGSEPAPIRSNAKRTKYMLSLTRNSLSNWTRNDLHAGISRPLESLFSPSESGALSLGISQSVLRNGSAPALRRSSSSADSLRGVVTWSDASSQSSKSRTRVGLTVLATPHHSPP
jgi:hypothetical protein